jgi:hypothetical protein
MAAAPCARREANRSYASLKTSFEQQLARVFGKVPDRGSYPLRFEASGRTHPLPPRRSHRALTPTWSTARPSSASPGEGIMLKKK